MDVERIRNDIAEHSRRKDEEIASLRAELEAARVDAERYRWLRHADMDGVCVVDVNVWLDFDIADCEQIDGDKLDAAIDAARGGK